MWTPAASRACLTVIPKRTFPMPFRCTSCTPGTMPGAWAEAGAASAIKGGGEQGQGGEAERQAREGYWDCAQSLCASRRSGIAYQSSRNAAPVAAATKVVVVLA